MIHKDQKPIKLYYSQQVHKLSKPPVDFKTLVEKIKLAFNSDLPETWSLRYKDFEEDQVMLQDESDYQTMLQCQWESPSRSTKIFLIPFEQNYSAQPSAVQVEPCQEKPLDCFPPSVSKTETEIEKSSAKEKEVENKETLVSKRQKHDKIPFEYERKIEESEKSSARVENSVLGTKEKIAKSIGRFFSKVIEVTLGGIPLERQEEKDNPYCVSFVKEMNTIPSLVTVKTAVINKRILLKNNGASEWPENTFICHVDGIEGQDTLIMPVAPGEELSCVILLRNPKQAGDYLSIWRPAFYDSEGKFYYIGEEFYLSFTVFGDELNCCKPNCKCVTAANKKENNPGFFKYYGY